MLAFLRGMCNLAHCMDDDLIPTSEVAKLLGRSVATINRWAAEGRGVPEPAVDIPGRGGVRMYRRSDVEALAAERAAS